MSGLLHHYWNTAIKPKRTFNALLADSRKLLYGFYAILVMSLLYAIGILFVAIGQGKPLM